MQNNQIYTNINATTRAYTKKPKTYFSLIAYHNIQLPKEFFVYIHESESIHSLIELLTSIPDFAS